MFLELFFFKESWTNVEFETLSLSKRKGNKLSNNYFILLQNN